MKEHIKAELMFRGPPNEYITANAMADRVRRIAQESLDPAFRVRVYTKPLWGTPYADVVIVLTLPENLDDNIDLESHTGRIGRIDASSDDASVSVMQMVDFAIHSYLATLVNEFEQWPNPNPIREFDMSLLPPTSTRISPVNIEQRTMQDFWCDVAAIAIAVLALWLLLR